MTDRNGVEIDYCPSCRGVWLDRGELDKIIERSSQYGAGESQKQYDDDRREGKYYGDDKRDGHHHPHKKKRGSFLGDLFDF
jgi:uncharacterized protein